MAQIKKDSIGSLLEPHMALKEVIQGSRRRAHFIRVSWSEKRFCRWGLNDWQLLAAALRWDMSRHYFLSGSTQRPFSAEAAGSLIQRLSKSWQNAFHSAIWDAKGIKSRPICCLCLAGRIFCMGLGRCDVSWRLLGDQLVLLARVM